MRRFLLSSIALTLGTVLVAEAGCAKVTSKTWEKTILSSTFGGAPSVTGTLFVNPNNTDIPGVKTKCSFQTTAGTVPADLQTFDAAVLGPLTGHGGLSANLSWKLAPDGKTAGAPSMNATFRNADCVEVTSVTVPINTTMRIKIPATAKWLVVSTVGVVHKYKATLKSLGKSCPKPKRRR